jgi:hypothetical protein
LSLSFEVILDFDDKFIDLVSQYGTEDLAQVFTSFSQYKKSKAFYDSYT